MYQFQPKMRLAAIVGLNVKATVKKTLLVVDGFMNSHVGACFPSVGTIARRRGLSHRTIQYHLKRLEDMGLIERRARHAGNGRQRSNLYRPSYLEMALAHPHVHGVSDAGKHEKLHPPLPQNCTPLTKTIFEPKQQIKTKTPDFVTETGGLSDAQWREAFALVGGFLREPREDRGLLALEWQHMALTRNSIPHQRALDRLRISWRWEL